ncbi:unnamed protein product [Gadus morhua 'NCC']
MESRFYTLKCSPTCGRARLKAPPALTNVTRDPCSSERLCVSLGNQRTHEEPFSLLETRSQASPSHW